jgi:hypothetical protein
MPETKSLRWASKIEQSDNFFTGECSIFDAHLRLFFRAFHYERPCINLKYAFFEKIVIYGFKFTSVGINMYKAIVLDDISFNHASESFKNSFKLFVGSTFGNVADK